MTSPEQSAAAAARWRKKPVVIEAMLFDGYEKTAKEIISTFDPKHIMQSRGNDFHGVLVNFWIVTLEGQMQANAGDWIIRGIKGEIYPCKPDIFEATYERE